MQVYIKNALGIAGVVGIVLLASAAVMYANAFSSSIQPGSYRSFAASGQAKVSAIPDVARISFTVVTEGGKDLAALQKQNVDKANAAIDMVKSTGVDAKDIKTESYSVNPRYQNYNCYPQPYDSGSPSKVCPPPEIVGYTINQTVLAKIRNFNNVGKILSGVVEKGANQVYGPNFVVDDETKARTDARAQAIQKAQVNAQEIARAGGFSLGRLLSIEDSGVYPMPYYAPDGRGAGGESMKSLAVPAPTIEPGSQDIQVSVILRYEIK